MRSERYFQINCSEYCIFCKKFIGDDEIICETCLSKDDILVRLKATIQELELILKSFINNETMYGFRGGLVKTKENRLKIGVVGVDSGQLVVCDPSYIDHSGKHKELNDYKLLLEKRADTGSGDLNRKEKYLQLKYDLGHDGLGVVFDSGWGDGLYEVYATIVDTGKSGKRIKKVEIVLIR